MKTTKVSPSEVQAQAASQEALYNVMNEIILMLLLIVLAQPTPNTQAGLGVHK